MVIGFMVMFGVAGLAFAAIVRSRQLAYRRFHLDEMTGDALADAVQSLPLRSPRLNPSPKRVAVARRRPANRAAMPNLHHGIPAR